MTYPGAGLPPQRRGFLLPGRPLAARCPALPLPHNMEWWGASFSATPRPCALGSWRGGVLCSGNRKPRLVTGAIARRIDGRRKVLHSPVSIRCCHRARHYGNHHWASQGVYPRRSSPDNIAYPFPQSNYGHPAKDGRSVFYRATTYEPPCAVTPCGAGGRYLSPLVVPVVPGMGAFPIRYHPLGFNP